MISHCRWGVTEEIKDQAQHLILIPDLYKGTVGVDAEEASHVYTPPAQMPSAKTQ